MITEISIANFRGIREGKLTDLAQVNVLVGRNNTGKSSVLEALALTAAEARKQLLERGSPFDPLDRPMPDYLFKRRVERGSSYLPELHFGLNIHNVIEVAAVFEDGAALSCSQMGDGQAELKGEKEKAEWLSRALLVDAPLTLDFRRLEQQCWPQILADRTDRELAQAVGEVYAMPIEHLSFYPYGGFYKLAVVSKERGVPVDAVGDGLRDAIAVLIVAAIVKDSALMIEELETHQHPESLQKLLLALFKLARRNSIQLFMTTHSLELIHYALEAAEKEELDLKLFHLALSPEGTLSARGMSAPDARALAEIGPDPRMLHKYISLSPR